MHYGKKVISVFQKIFTSHWQNFHFRRRTEHWAIILWRFEILLIFPNFPRSLHTVYVRQVNYFLNGDLRPVQNSFSSKSFSPLKAFWKLRLLPRVKLRYVHKHVLYFGIPEDVDLGSSEKWTQNLIYRTQKLMKTQEDLFGGTRTWWQIRE